MEELHRIHKDVPFGYWALWVAPAYRWLMRRWDERRVVDTTLGLDRLSGPH